MKLEIKNFKFYEEMSEETNAFTGTLHVNGKKVADLKNDGHGGMTDVRAYPEHRETVRQAEEFAKTLECPYDGLTMSLNFWCDIQVERLVKEKDLKKYSNKGLLLGKGKEWTGQIVKWNLSISQLLKSETGVQALQKTIAKYEAQGYTVFNTNIPKWVTA